jgi:hypothetical protein
METAMSVVEMASSHAAAALTPPAPLSRTTGYPLPTSEQNSYHDGGNRR